MTPLQAQTCTAAVNGRLSSAHGLMATATGAQSENQNCCSFTISPSSTMGFPAAGAVTVTCRVTLWPGARSCGSDTRWSVSQACRYEAVCAGQPPAEVEKCNPRRTGVLPPDGQGWLPVLVTLTVTLWVWPGCQVFGTTLMS